MTTSSVDTITHKSQLKPTSLVSVFVLIVLVTFFTNPKQAFAFTCGDTFEVSHAAGGGVAPVDKTVTYGTVLSNLTGEDMCWITQNLGATDQGSSYTDGDEGSAGWYWQFGIRQGYKYDSSRTPDPGSWKGNFEFTADGDWNSAEDPCALELGEGWRIPTATEWSDTATNGGWSNGLDQYASDLKIHAGGWLDDFSGSVVYRGERSRHFSSTEDYDLNALTIYAAAGGINSSSSHAKTNATPLRCIHANDFDNEAPAITLTPLSPDPTTNLTPTITGTASDSAALVSSVEYQMDATDGSWTACSADDGSFDEAEEAFTCEVSPSLTEAAHIIYVRATDSNANTTQDGSYAEDSFTVALPTPTPTPTTAPTATPTPTSNPPTETSNETSDSDTGSEFTPQISSSSGGSFRAQNSSMSLRQIVLTILKPNTFTFEAFLSAIPIMSVDATGGLVHPLTGEERTYSYQPKNIRVAGEGVGRLLGITTTNGTHWQLGHIHNVWYKAYAAGVDKQAAAIIPELQTKPSILSISFDEADLIPPGQPTKQFQPTSMRLAYSSDGVNWRILDSSVVDTTNQTVAAVTTVGGYYTIVGKM